MFEGLFQPMHMLVIMLIFLIFFGPGKLPELGSGLGKAIREFKKSMADINNPQLENRSPEAKTEREENKAV